MNIQEAFDTVRNAIAEYEDDITSKKSELETLADSINNAEQNHTKVLENIALVKAKFAEEKKRLEKDIAPIRQEYAELKEEVIKLTDQKAALMRDNIAAQERHNYLVAYEKKATKALKAKDEELLLREKKVSEREQMKPLGDSFLPVR